MVRNGQGVVVVVMVVVVDSGDGVRGCVMDGPVWYARGHPQLTTAWPSVIRAKVHIKSRAKLYCPRAGSQPTG